MSTLEHYTKQRNANLFISNNANPFLISPYSPTQISRTTGNNVITANIIRAYNAGDTIQVTSPINFTAASINGNALSTSEIYCPNTKLACEEIGLSREIKADFNGSTEIIFSNIGTVFGVSTPTYEVLVNGQFGMQTTVVPPGGQVLQGYVPFLVNGIQYYLPIYQ